MMTEATTKRELRFRAWYKKIACMLSWDYLTKHRGAYGFEDFGREDLIFMQFTGLRDKNGKEIYEGDIVRTQEYTDKPWSKTKKHHRHVGVVVYSIGQGNCFYNEASKKFDSHSEYEAGWDIKIEDKGIYRCSNWGPFYDCEVIGNLYEHPDLLEVAP